LLVVAILVAGVAVQAQVKFGVKAGANFYQLTGEDAESFEESRKMKIGIAGGGFAVIPVSSMFSVVPELLYSMEGNKQAEDDAKVLINLNYLNIPVMFRYNNPSGFFAETGPQVGFLMSAKTKTEFAGEEEETDVKEYFKGVNFSWGIGAGYQLNSGLGFGARYNLGLASIYDEDDVKIKSSGFNIGVFYTFGGSK